MEPSSSWAAYRCKNLEVSRRSFPDSATRLVAGVHHQVPWGSRADPAVGHPRRVLLPASRRHRDKNTCAREQANSSRAWAARNAFFADSYASDPGGVQCTRAKQMYKGSGLSAPSRAYSRGPGCPRRLQANTVPGPLGIYTDVARRPIPFRPRLAHAPLHLRSPGDFEGPEPPKLEDDIFAAATPDMHSAPLRVHPDPPLEVGSARTC